MNCNLIAVDKGALTLAVNALRRAGEDGMASELLCSVQEIEYVLMRVAIKDPHEYMKNVTNDMLTEYT